MVQCHLFWKIEINMVKMHSDGTESETPQRRLAFAAESGTEVFHFPGLTPSPKPLQPDLPWTSQCSLSVLPALEKPKYIKHLEEKLKLSLYPHHKRRLQLTYKQLFFEVHKILFFRLPLSGGEKVSFYILFWVSLFYLNICY